MEARINHERYFRVTWVQEDERSWEFRIRCNQRIFPISDQGFEAEISFDSQPPVPRPTPVTFALRHAFLSVSLNNGRRNMSELLDREGYEVIEEVWRMWVSDCRSSQRVPDRYSSFVFSRAALYCVRQLVISPTISH